MSCVPKHSARSARSQIARILTPVHRPFPRPRSARDCRSSSQLTVGRLVQKHADGDTEHLTLWPLPMTLQPAQSVPIEHLRTIRLIGSLIEED